MAAFPRTDPIAIGPFPKRPLSREHEALSLPPTLFRAGEFMTMASFQELVLSFACLALSSITIHHFFLLRNGPNEPPLVKGPLPFLGCAISLQRNFRSFLLQNRAKYGDIFCIYVAGKRIHIISDPVDGIPTHFRNRNFGFSNFSESMRRKVFLNTVEEIQNTSMSNDLAASLIPSLLSVEATNVLVDRLLAHSEPTLKRWTESVGNEWKQVDLIDWCCSFPKDDELYRDLMKFDNNLVTVWRNPEIFLWKEQAVARKLIQRMKTFYANGMDPSEIVRVRVEVAQEHGHEAYVPKDLLTLSWSSLTNAMSTLFWLLAYIHLNSQQADFLHEIETYTTAASHPKIADTDFHKLLSSSSLLNSALKETLRIQGHSISPRNIEADTLVKVNGREYLLKKGSLAFAPSTLLNWNPDIYPEPQEWKADRFIEKAVREDDYLGVEHGPKLDTKKLKFPLLIWGGGSHMCPGRRFATNELLIMLTMFLRYFEIAPLEGEIAFPNPADPPKDQYGLGVKPPARPWIVRMRARIIY